MLRLSRLRDVVLIAIAFAVLGVAVARSVYLFVLNRRVTRELVQHTWREPVILYGKGDAEVARLYGADWRPMPLVAIDSIPKYVGNAFVAAEDVRFRHHIGADPIAMTRRLPHN